MTVKELIDQLQLMDPELVVYRDAGECSVYYTPRVVFESDMVVESADSDKVIVAPLWGTLKCNTFRGVIIE